MRAGAGQVEVSIRDISSHGMLIQTDAPPPRGTYVEILRSGYSVTGRVVWSKQYRFGIEARGRISVSAVLERRSTPRSGGGKAPLNQSGGPVSLSPRADVAGQAARARARSALLQYAVLGGAAATAALMLAFGLYRGLADTFTDVIRQLG